MIFLEHILIEVLLQLNILSTEGVKSHSYCFQSRVVSSRSRPASTSPEDVLRADLSSMLAVLSQAESVLLRRSEELQVRNADLCCSSDSHRAPIVCLCSRQGAELNLRRLGEVRTSLQLQVKRLQDDHQQLLARSQHTQQELTHTLSVLSR